MDLESNGTHDYPKCSADHCHSKRMMVCLKPSCLPKCLICPMCAQYEHNGPLHLVQHLDEFKEETLKLLSCNTESQSFQFLDALRSSKAHILNKIKQLQNIAISLVKKLRYAVNNQFQTFIQSFSPETQKKEYYNFSHNLTDVKVINAAYRVQVLKRNEFGGKAENVKATQKMYQNVFDEFMPLFLKSACVFEKLQYVADLRFSDNALNKKIAELNILQNQPQVQTQEIPSTPAEILLSKAQQIQQSQFINSKIEEMVKIIPGQRKRKAICIDSSPESKRSSSSRSREKRKKQHLSPMEIEQSKDNAPRRKPGDSIRAESKGRISSFRKPSSTLEVKPLSIQSQAQRQCKSGQKVAQGQVQHQKSMIQVAIEVFQNKNKPSTVTSDQPTVTIEYYNKKDLNKKNDKQLENLFARKSDKSQSYHKSPATDAQKMNQKSGFFPIKVKVSENTVITNKKLDPQPTISSSMKNNYETSLAVPKKNNQEQPDLKVNTPNSEKPEEKKQLQNKQLEAEKAGQMADEKPTDPRPPRNSLSNESLPTPAETKASCYRVGGALRPSKKPTTMTTDQLMAWFRQVYKPRPGLSMILSHRGYTKYEYFWYYDGEFKWQTEKQLRHVDEGQAIKSYWKSLSVYTK